MDKKQLAAFVQWLQSNVDEFKDKSPEETVAVLNKMSQSEEGTAQIAGLVEDFKQSAGMFEKGGKLSYLVGKIQKNNKAVKPEKKESVNSSIKPKTETASQANAKELNHKDSGKQSLDNKGFDFSIPLNLTGTFKNGGKVNTRKFLKKTN